MERTRVLGGCHAQDQGTLTSVSRVLTDDEELEISELFKNIRGSSTEGITSLARALTSELKDIDEAILNALDTTGSTMASLSEYVSEVERSLEDINAWSAVFETKLMNMRGNIEIIKNRSDEIEATATNKGRLVVALRSLLQELKLPIDAVNTLEHGQIDDENGIVAVCSAAKELLTFQDKLRHKLPQSTSSMLATREAHENANAITQRLLARVFENFHSITEKWSVRTMHEALKGVKAPWESPHSELNKFEELFRVLAELNASAMSHFAHQYCICWAKVLQHDMKSTMNAISERLFLPDGINVDTTELTHNMRSISVMIDIEADYLMRMFNIASEMRENYTSELITGLEETLLNSIDSTCRKDGALLLPLFALMDRCSYDLTSAASAVLLELLKAAQVAIDGHLSRFIGELIQQLEKVSSAKVATGNSQGEYNFPMHELDGIRRVINFTQYLRQVRRTELRIALETSLEALCAAACEHVETLAAATSKRNDRVRLQGYFSLKRCFSLGDSHDEPLTATYSHLNHTMVKVSTSYISVICEKHFGSFFVDLYSRLRDPSAVRSVNSQAQLLKSYKLAIPNIRGFEKTAEAVSKTMMKDLIQSELCILLWSMVEEHVIHGLSALESNPLVFGPDHVATVSIDDARRVLSKISRAFGKT